MGEGKEAKVWEGGGSEVRHGGGWMYTAPCGREVWRAIERARWSTETQFTEARAKRKAAAGRPRRWGSPNERWAGTGTPSSCPACRSG